MAGDLPKITEADIQGMSSEQSFQRGLNYYRSGALFEPVRQDNELRRLQLHSLPRLSHPRAPGHPERPLHLPLRLGRHLQTSRRPAPDLGPRTGQLPRPPAPG